METVLDARVSDDPGQEVVLVVVIGERAVAVVLRLPARHVREDSSQVNGDKDGGGDADEDADGGENGAENLLYRGDRCTYAKNNPRGRQLCRQFGKFLINQLVLFL